MTDRNDSPEKELSKTHLQETLEIINHRQQFFAINQLSSQSELLRTNNTLIKTISEVIPQLGAYLLNQSPIQPTLRDLYTSQYDNQHPRYILPPASEGQQSINESLSYQPSFLWVSKSIIDSTMIECDQPEPKKVGKGKVPEQWQKITQLLIFDINKKIHLKKDVKLIERYLGSTFEKYKWVQIAKIKCLYFKGKPSVIIKFSDEIGCLFAYFNLSVQHHRKETFGPTSEVFRVTHNRIKQMSSQKSVYVVFRKLPSILNKQSLVQILKRRKIQPLWVEQLILIDSFRYTLCKVQYLENAFDICTQFQINPPYKGIKVNLHPKSSKSWEIKTGSEAINEII